MDSKDFLEFEARILRRLDRIVELLEGMTAPKEHGEPKAEAKNVSDREKVSEEMFSRYAPEIVRHAFEEESYSTLILAEDLGISRQTVTRIIKRLEDEEHFLTLKSGEVQISDPKKAAKWLEQFQPPTEVHLDTYTKKQVARLLRVLLREENRAVGKVTKSLADELGLQRAACERLVRIITQQLPFATKGPMGSSGGLIRIKPYQLDAAEAWTAEVESEPDEKAPDWAPEGLSEESFKEKAPIIVDLLLGQENGVALHTLSEQTNTKKNMLRAILMRLHREGIQMAVPVAVVGFQTIRIVDQAAAERWLSEKTAPPSRKMLNSAAN